MNTEQPQVHQAAPRTSDVQPQAPSMRAYHVAIRRGSQVTREFEAMAPDSVTAVMQHMDLCGPLEKIEVMSLEAWRESRREHAALERQVAANRHDPVLGGLYS